MKKLIGLMFFIMIFCSVKNTFGQSYALDAWRFSQPSLSGSARVQGIGGTSVAIGGDMSNITANPAGLGFFTKSEFSFSPGINIAGTSTDYNTFRQDDGQNPTTKDSRSAGMLNNLGLVFYSGKDAIEGGKWRGGSFGISLMRTATYQNNISFEGLNDATSKTDYYVDQTDGLRPADLDFLPEDAIYPLQTAWYFASLTNPINFLGNGEVDPNNTKYESYFRDPFTGGTLLGNITQRGNINSRGSQNQISFAYGGNYDDKFYFGLSAQLSTLNNTRRTTYFEQLDLNATIPAGLAYLDSFTEIDDLTTRGSGLSVSAGFIYRPLDYIRIGASIQSPTWYRLRENFGVSYESLIINEDDSQEGFTEDTNPGFYNYNLTTPMRASGGIAFFLGKYGFISADVEYIPYNTIRLRDEANSGAIRESNQFIQNQFKNVLNYKIGAEARLDIFRVRGGFQYQGDALAGVDQLDRSTSSISGGFGVRLQDWYLDLALVNTRFNSLYSPYDFTTRRDGQPSDFRSYSPVATTKNQFWNGVLSIGFYF
jgi:long-subunit fatty acid transport protein